MNPLPRIPWFEENAKHESLRQLKANFFACHIFRSGARAEYGIDTRTAQSPAIPSIIFLPRFRVSPLREVGTAVDTKESSDTEAYGAGTSEKQLRAILGLHTLPTTVADRSRPRSNAGIKGVSSCFIRLGLRVKFWSLSQATVIIFGGKPKNATSSKSRNMFICRQSKMVNSKAGYL